MGINLTKVPISKRPMYTPVIIENPDQAGSIYLVIHKPKTQTTGNPSNKPGNEIGKTSHFSIALDVTGSSTAENFIATHYDLRVKSSTDYTTCIDPTLKTKPWDHYHLIRKVGRVNLQQITQFLMPNLFAVDLYNRLYQQVYGPLFIANGGAQWSSILNCQTLTRLSIEFLGYQFPNDIRVITDVVPTLFDIYVNGSLITAQACTTSRERLSC